MSYLDDPAVREWTEKAQLKKLDRMVEAGSAILYERVAEAYEPSWRHLLIRVYAAMAKAEEAPVNSRRGAQREGG